MSYIGRSPQLGVRTRFYYTATGGETSLSGADDNGNTLIFSDGTYVDVLLNGITLVAGADYNTSTANTISGLAALTAADVAEIVVYDVFSVGDAVSKSNGGTFDGVVNFGAGANGEIGGTTPAAGAFTTLEATSLDSTPIGGSTPAAGTFTTLAATGNTTLDGTAVVKQGLPIIDESGTSKTLALSDNGGYIVTSNGSAVTITVPPNSSVAFPTGAEIVVFQSGAGQVDFVAGSGVTIRSKDSNLKISAQYAAATLKKVATDEWHLLGDLAA
jgi:hypothetical protein